jgi:two-component system nitrate/nitrite response regulator NarL
MGDGSSRGADGTPERLLVLVLNASPTRSALLTAALDTWEGISCRAQEEPAQVEPGEESPDVVLVDLATGQRPDRSTELLVRRALDTYPNAATMLLSDNPSPAAKELMKRLPLSGCVMSSQKLESVAASLKLAHQGIAVLPRVLLDQLRRARAATPVPPRSRRSVAPRSQRFTGRQAEVVHLLMEGLSNKAIAHRLGITESTVKNHVRSIMTRMGVISRTQVVLALLHGR